MDIGRVAYRAWRVASGMPARLPDLNYLEPDAPNGEVRRVLAVLERHRRGFEVWVKDTRAGERLATRWVMAIDDEEALVKVLIRDIERHRGEPELGRPGDGDWTDYNYPLQATKVRL